MVHVGKCFLGVAEPAVWGVCRGQDGFGSHGAAGGWKPTHQGTKSPSYSVRAELVGAAGQRTKARRNPPNSVCAQLVEVLFCFSRSKTGQPLMLRIACGSDRFRANGDGRNFRLFMPSPLHASPKPPTSPHAKAKGFEPQRPTIDCL
jgi:hypothetical protein